MNSVVPKLNPTTLRDYRKEREQKIVFSWEQERSKTGLSSDLVENRVRSPKHSRVSSEYLLIAGILAVTAILMSQSIWFGLVGLQQLLLFYYFKVSTSKKWNKPKRIILIRHGESEGNVDQTRYAEIPDNIIALTSNGIEQAQQVGKSLRELIQNETVRFFVSPYLRARQTLEQIIKSGNFDPQKYTVREEPRLREQDFGNFQDPLEVQQSIRDRQLFGSFYYRLPHGESGSDCFDRVTSFWSSVHREWKYEHSLENYVIVAHGITNRVFLMRYFKWTVKEYHSIQNFENGGVAIMELQSSGKYKLVTPLKTKCEE